MYINLVVIYTIVFSVKFVFSGVNVNNGANVRNTHRMYLNNQNNAQNGQINRPVPLPKIARNNQPEPILLHQQRQNVKGLLRNNSPLLPLRQPLNTVQTKSGQNYHALFSNERIDNLHKTGNQFPVTNLRNDKISINNIKRQTQNKLIQVFNRDYNQPEKLKGLPFAPADEHKGIRRSGLPFEYKNTRINIPSIPKYESIVPMNISKKDNKVTDISNTQKSVINHTIERQKPAILMQNQNVFRQQGNIQPQKTLQNPRSNIQTNHFSKNKRFAVIHDNGSVEYFDDLEIITRKYPHIRIPNNILKLIPNSNPLTKPTVYNSDFFEILKINQSVKHPNLPKGNVPPIMPFTLPISATFPVEVNGSNKKVDNLKSQTKGIPVKTTNNVQIKPRNSQNNKQQDIITATLSPESIVTTKFNDFHANNNKATPFKNPDPIDGNKDKLIIDVQNVAKQIPHQDNKTNNTSPVTSNKKNEHYYNVTSELGKDDLILNKSKEVVSTAVLPDKNNSKSINSTSENKIEMIHNASNKDNVQSDKTKPNCTKQNGLKNKLKTQNTDVIKQTAKEEYMYEDYDEDLLSLAKPLMWFSTTDPEFWKKLVSADESPNFLYIINVQSQPKIEKDTKTIIHANGTVVEEITETIWDAGDDEQPKITKTIKVTPAKVSDGT